MPTAAGVPIFEDVVALLQSKPSPFALAGHMDVITGGLTDLANRLKNLEHGSLVNAAGVDKANAKLADHETRLSGFEGDRDDFKARIAKLEAAPEADKKRLDDLDARVRTVEGAVGSTNFAAAKDAPAPKPFTGPSPTDPVNPIVVDNQKTA
jgi:hypothetical protein